MRMPTDTDPDAPAILPAAWQGLTGTERDVLVTIAATGPATATRINDALGREYSHRNTIQRALDPLREAGFVASDPASDLPGPSKYNRLTDAGRDLVATVTTAQTRAVDA